ncbi:MAG: riboflavin kinase [bacterium]|nr:riboflavin kinase [bacterium]
MLFSFSGVVQKHLGRGKTLGYPTANIPIDPETQEGIFVGSVLYGETSYPALVFVGKPLTFGEYDKKAEIFLLDFDDDLYGKTLEISVLKKLRNNEQFNNQDALVAQMKEDERQAREYFSTMK